MHVQIKWDCDSNHCVLKEELAPSFTPVFPYNIVCHIAHSYRQFETYTVDNIVEDYKRWFDIEAYEN